MMQRRNIVATPVASKSYQLKKLKESKTSQVFGDMFYPFDAIFYEELDNQHLEKLHQYTKLHSLNTKDYIKDVSNFNDLYRFAKECAEYEVALDENIFDKNSKNYEVIRALKSLEIKIQKPQNIRYLKEGLSHSQLTYLENNNYQIVNEESESLNPKIIQAHALNPILEIEHALYTITQNKLDDAVIFVDNKDAKLPFVIYACEKLGLNYSSNTSDYKLAKMIASSLLDYYVVSVINKDGNKTNTKILELFKRNIFNLKYAKQISDYFTYTRFPLENKSYEFDDYDIKNEKMNEEYLSVIHILEKLKSHDLKDALEMIYELTRFLNKQGASIIKSYFQNIMPLVTKENIHFVLYELENLSSYDFKSEYFEILDYASVSVTAFNHVFITGLNASTYPNIKEKTGLVNETLIEKLNIQAMSLENRITHTENIKEAMFNIAKKSLTIYSHELDLEGAQMDEALINQEILKEATQIKVNLNYEKTDYFIDKPTLSKKTINKHFKPKGFISLSPSAMKAYIDDPIQYIKDNILKARIDNLDLKQHLIFGNLNHALLEYHYKNKDSHNLEEKYKALYPKVSYKDLIFDLNQNILNSFIQFSDEELSSSNYATKPENIELEGLKTVLTLKEDKKIEIHGRIDRFDTKEENIRIIDYKASSHPGLRKNAKGITDSSQLQLLSYMALLDDKFKNKTISNAQFFPYELMAGNEQYEVISTRISSKEKWHNAYTFDGLLDVTLENWENMFKTILFELVMLIEEGNLDKNEILDRLKQSTKENK